MPRPILEDISVIIPTLGRPILEESLYWIVTGSAWPKELIVVDQGRRPEIAAWTRSLGTLGIDVKYIPSTQRGPSAGVNRGLEQANTRFVVLVDDDCFVEKQWLANMNAHLLRNSFSLVTGRVEPGTEDVIVVVTSQTPSVQHRPHLSFDRLSRGNMGTSLAVIQQIGPFDEDPRLRTSEDGEFAYRALRNGISIYYEPDVGVRHFGWRDNEQRKMQYKGYAFGHGVFYGKYLRKGDGFIALRVIVHHIRALRWWMRGIMRGDSEIRHFGQAYLTTLLPGIIDGMRKSDIE